VELSKIAEQSAKGGFSLIVGTAASTVIGALVVIVIARLLGPSGYGLYSLAFVIPPLFASASDLGLSSAITRYAASLCSENQFGRAAGMIRSVLIFTSLTGLIAFLVAYGSANQIAAWLQRSDIAVLIAVGAITILFQELFSVAYNALVGLDRMDQSAIMLVLRDLVRLIVSSTLIIVGFGVLGAVSGQVFGWAAACTVGVVLLLASRRALKLKARVDDSEVGLTGDLRTMMGYSLPLYLSSLIGAGLIQYQVIVLAFYTTNAEIGNFRAAANFATLITVVATPITTALFPAFSKLDLKTRPAELKMMFNHAVKYVTLIILPGMVLVALLSKDLVRALYGSAYRTAPAYLTLYVLLYSLASIGYLVNSPFLSGVGKTKETLKIGLIQLAVFLPLAPALTWLFHVQGLILAYLTSLLLFTCAGLGFTRRCGMQIDFRASSRLLLAALLAAVPILPIALLSLMSSYFNVIFGGAAYCVIYMTLVPLFRAVTKTDLDELYSIGGKVRWLAPVIRMILRYESRLLSLFWGEPSLAVRT
jgi:O-antigen/teichoic acid export membrane protein